MGKAVIEEALGEGLYRVRVDYGSTYRDLKIEAIDKALAELEPVLAEHQARLTSAEVIRANAAAQIDHMIGIYRQAVAEGVPADEMDPIRQALKDLATAHAEATKQVQIARLSVTDITTLIAETLQQKHALEGLRLEEVFPAWCTDYTEDAQPGTEVGTMEVPGEPQQIIIVPGCQPWSPSHGELRKKELMEAHQAYFNVAILPGWQRFWPTYRIGTVTAVHANDTVDVELEGTSTAQNLDIGPPSPTGTASDVVLSSVPVDYMSSGNTVFEVNDRVVVLLQNFDWSQPVVVGFEKEPRPVVGLLCHPADAPQYRVFPSAIHGAVTWRASQLQSPATLNVNYGTRGWTDGKKAVSWSNNKNTFFHRAFYRGRQADLVSMFPELYYYNAANDYVMPWILGCVAAGEYVVALVYTYQPQRAGTVEARLAAALPNRRVDLLAFRYNRESGPLWLEPTVCYSEVLPVMPYLSGGAAVTADPNHSGHLYGRCQGCSISRNGSSILFFYDTEVYRFHVGLDVDGALATDLTFVAHPNPGEYKRTYRDFKLTEWSGTNPDCSADKLISRIEEEETETDECSGAWHVGAKWNSDGSISWIDYEVNVYRLLLDGSYVTHETLTNMTWWKPAGDCTWTADPPNLYPSVESYLMHRLEVNLTTRDCSYKYTGAVLLDVLLDTEHISNNTETTYVREYKLDPLTGFWVHELVDTVTVPDSSHDPVDLSGWYLHDHLDLNRGYMARNAFVYAGFPAVETIGEIQLYAGDSLLYASEKVGSSHRNDYGPSIAMVTVKNDIYEGGLEKIEEGYGDPFTCNMAAAYCFSTAGQMGDVKGAVFFSVNLDGEIANHMTDNPAISDVFPEDSGVDTGANFAPIVPH